MNAESWQMQPGLYTSKTRAAQNNIKASSNRPRRIRILLGSDNRTTEGTKVVAIDN
jgi:hypothetical protein